MTHADGLLHRRSQKHVMIINNLNSVCVHENTMYLGSAHSELLSRSGITKVTFMSLAMATMSQIWHIKSSHILHHKQFTSLTISKLNAKNKNKIKKSHQ